MKGFFSFFFFFFFFFFAWLFFLCLFICSWRWLFCFCFILKFVAVNYDSLSRIIFIQNFILIVPCFIRFAWKLTPFAIGVFSFFCTKFRGIWIISISDLYFCLMADCSDEFSYFLTLSWNKCLENNYLMSLSTFCCLLLKVFKIRYLKNP